MSLGELAAFVCSHLKKHGIYAVLSGGACVSIYTENKYQSYDLDFIENISTRRNTLGLILKEIGFSEENRYFTHPDTVYFIEFPPGPLSVGDEPVKDIVTKEFSTGELRLISPTDCAKDRLAAYYHWNDKQCLEQTVWIAQNHRIDLDEILRWSKHENKESEYELIRERFITAQRNKNMK
jgi:hypothetical protein